MKIKITINPDTDNEAVIQGDFPEMKEFLENSLRLMLKWMSGESMSRFPSDTEEWIYNRLNDAYDQD